MRPKETPRLGCDVTAHDQWDDWPWPPGTEKTHPTIVQERWVRVRAHIRNNETGEVRTNDHRLSFYEDGVTPNVFNWEENNYSCDCNRGLFFGRANGGKGDECACGETKYAVNLENPRTGEVFYREFAK